MTVAELVAEQTSLRGCVVEKRISAVSIGDDASCGVSIVYDAVGLPEISDGPQRRRSKVVPKKRSLIA